MTPDKLVRVLLMVPEQRLAILDLVWELMGDDGRISPEKAVFAAVELRLAASEARRSREDNRRLLEALARWR